MRDLKKGFEGDVAISEFRDALAEWLLTNYGATDFVIGVENMSEQDYNGVVVTKTDDESFVLQNARIMLHMSGIPLEVADDFLNQWFAYQRQQEEAAAAAGTESDAALSPEQGVEEPVNDSQNQEA